MKSFMWVITLIVLSTATLITATAENISDSNARQARFTKGEIPLLLIRPVHRSSGSTKHYSRMPMAQSRVSYVNEDMSMLESILPQLGFDPNLFSAYPLGAPSGNQPKKHLVPIQQNEIPKYHHLSSNYQPDIHLKFKEPDYKPNYSFNYAPQQQQQQSHQQPQQPSSAPLIASYNGHKEHALNQNERYLDKPLFIPTDNLPSEINVAPEPKYASPLNIVNPPSSYSLHSHNSGSVHRDSANTNYKSEKYFEPKPIDFNLIKTKEELVIGKSTAPINLHVPNSGYKSTTTTAGKQTSFYIPKHENTASFEVKSKTENVQFVPDFITKYNEKPTVQQTFGQQKNFTKPLFEPFKQTAKYEYFIPKGQEMAAVKVSSDTEEYYKKFETDEYFLPKREPAYHKMADVQLYKNKQTTTTTEFPSPSDSYSFMINDDGYSDIHIKDHVYPESDKLFYGYDSESGEAENQSSENHYARTSFYPSNHKEFDSKMTALDYVQSSIKSNLNNLFDEYENKKTKLISSTYKKEDFTAQPELNFAPSSEPLKITDQDASYYFAKSNDDREELNTFYSTLKPFQPVQTTPKTTYVRPSFSLSAVRPIYEPYQDESDANDKSGETSYENDYKDEPGKLYLNERESDSYENEVSTIFPKLVSTVKRATTEEPIIPTTRFEIKFPTTFTTPKITTYKSRYSPTIRSTTTESSHGIVSSTSHKPSKYETTTHDSGVNLLSGVACERQCIRNTVSQVYDPVCGSDDKTYSNKGKLRCTRTCGKSDLHVKHYGGCGHK